MDKLSKQQERGPNTVGQLLTLIKELQDKVNSLSDARDFHDPDTASSSGASHVPNKPFVISSSKRKLSCDSGLLRDTRNGVGIIQGNLFEDPLAREGHPTRFFENSRNLASSSRRLGNDSTGNVMEREQEVRQEPLHSSIPLPCFHKEQEFKIMQVEFILTMV